MVDDPALASRRGALGRHGVAAARPLALAERLWARQAPATIRPIRCCGSRRRLAQRMLLTPYGTVEEKAAGSVEPNIAEPYSAAASAIIRSIWNEPSSSMAKCALVSADAAFCRARMAVELTCACGRSRMGSRAAPAMSGRRSPRSLRGQAQQAIRRCCNRGSATCRAGVRSPADGYR
jgi:hypothetical protein